MPFSIHRFAWAVATLVSAAIPAHAAPRYHVRDLGPAAFVVQIDSQGVVCGQDHKHPALWAEGTWTRIGNESYFVKSCKGDWAAGYRQGSKNGAAAVVWKPKAGIKLLVHGGVDSYSTVIRQDGRVYGAALMPEGHSFPFTWKDGTMTTMPFVEGFDWTVPAAVNSALEIAGWAANTALRPGCPMVPLLYTGGSWTDLGSLGGTCGQSRGINDDGTVVGWSMLAGDSVRHAFSWSNGAMSDLGTLGGATSQADDINDIGQIVGTSLDATGRTRAFIFTDGVMTPLDTLVLRSSFKGTLEEAVSINSAGQIIVQGHSRHHTPHAFLLDPA